MGYDIYGIGNALVDKEFEVEDSFFAKAGIEKGLMTLIDEDKLQALLAQLTAEYGIKKRASGGSAANTIIGATYFGAKTWYSCNVANDEAGEFYMNDIQTAGVDTNLGFDREEGTTGRCLVMVTPDAERTMNTFLGITANLNDSHINEEALASSKYVYVEGYLVTGETSRAAAIKVRDLARKHGVKVAMTCSDPAMAQYFRDGLLSMLGDGVDLLFCNEQEARLLTATDTLEAAVEQLKTLASTFAITCGANGALAWDGQQLHQIAPHKVTAVDSNGAGDMFAGAFLYALTHGHDFAAAGRLASAASAQVVSQFGPRLEPAQHAPLKEHLNG
ncbi:adenosine kinase [Parathalassolituus penaei]|uniref:Adenosine kinase n=1 Tax=Parathalassolituus penaei TaxID=2997323 RepID=A0A9X3ENU7_9GAMM|nr:adenosine kinase [Parathalassolituus penaei]MCY0966103.1 adenosine kinase [Parathalassolituus penaei]